MNLDINAVVQQTAENLPLVGLVLFAVVRRVGLLTESVTAVATSVSQLAAAIEVHEQRLDQLEGSATNAEA